jgi:hypothetical protein
MHRRLRCPDCHHWTDALLVWAAGDCCPSCNAPISLTEQEGAERSARPGRAGSWGGEDRPWRTPGRVRSPKSLEEQR